jgi:hypothetical protein
MKVKLMKFKIRIKHNQFKLLNNKMVVKIYKRNHKANIFKSNKMWKIQRSKIKIYQYRINKMKKNL